MTASSFNHLSLSREINDITIGDDEEDDGDEVVADDSVFAGIGDESFVSAVRVGECVGDE